LINVIFLQILTNTLCFLV